MIEERRYRIKEGERSWGNVRVKERCRKKEREKKKIERARKINKGDRVCVKIRLWVKGL